MTTCPRCSRSSPLAVVALTFALTAFFLFAGRTTAQEQPPPKDNPQDEVTLPSGQGLRETRTDGTRIVDGMRVFTNTAIVAKNPFVVLGTGGAYRHIRHLATPAERRGRLGFFDQPFVYLPMLLIVVLVHLKGYVPTVVKKIPDALGQLIHLVSGAPGLLFVMVEVFDTPAGSGNSGVAHLIEGFYIVVCAFVYLVIWAAFSVVEAAITLSPFGFVDPVLKRSRNLLLVTISAMSEIHPVLGFLAAFCVFLVCLWLVHFSIRCTVISLVYSFGLLGRMFGFAPAGNETIWAFSCWGLRGVPLCSRGRIRRRKTGPVFVYKRLFLVWERIVPLPEEMSV